ncbi:carbamoyltransferase HypF [Rhodovulum adriaticum]|uniref:Carbamoyltransferase HypF n=1 Tax=Rhodovulum adriaticum TaxID=35804 RepID=A0A4R2NL30_RHOAD|nr:carbamoyltransferase HypF [Rhodovulum adriaticum]MBK1636471.1 carbamoyltransferase HypF [Rhodovulum adriaticum]TCP22221.1 hydrogenase maturation carbamoyltransferase HypF [Rhodovulum adriaticum]
MQGLEIRVRGQVQGVGFRPFVWQLAQAHGVRGAVCNDAHGVLIHATGADLGAFQTALSDRAPALARVDAVEARPYTFDTAPEGFTITPSRGQGAETRVTPDAATCPACLAEIRAPGRRQGYAFTNCTHCGPRFTILQRLPYDRGQTTMAPFTMCPACRAEYENPADRRFHAQPIACPACGPRLWVEVDAAEQPGDPIAGAAQVLASGGIVAIKGLGGFHLACDATNEAAVQTLRTRKRRPAKPFALMAREGDLTDFCAPTPADLALMRDAAAPIVLVRGTGALPDAVAPGMNRLGVMLPYTPLHHLLLDAVERPLVMTSGNLSGEPQVIGNAEAREKLSAFADAFVMHDRAIARRLDDSVERAEPPMVLRRARGRVPGTLPLPPGFEDAPQIVAYGGQMKAAICLIKNGQALLGHHLGELDEALTWEAFVQADRDYAALFDHRPEIAACDLHPDFRATQHAQTTGLSVARVQHHHAHLAACLGENGWPLDGGPVAGIILDGSGLGPDGTVWGGEVLLGDYRDFTRCASLTPAPLIGGDRAQADPWRNALVRLDAAGLGDAAERLFPDAPLALARQAAAAGLNAPSSSSAGRLFDAVAACLGLCPMGQSFEGEAAMRLEALAEQALGETGYGFAVTQRELDPAPVFRAILADLDDGTAPARIAARFHAGLAQTFADAARKLVERREARAVALSGGCFQNALLLEQVTAALGDIPVLTHRLTPANDGGLALGQALVAAARHIAPPESG